MQWPVLREPGATTVQPLAPTATPKLSLFQLITISKPKFQPFTEDKNQKPT